jgi:glycosyltransferase involved in cell wall biosynthesis
VEITTSIVCTRNRPESLLRTVSALLADASENIEVLVVDQSDGPDSELALAELRRDPRLRYRLSPTRGKGAALNEGLREARGAIVVCTDDDCEPPPGWVTAMSLALASQPTAAIAFCQVLAVSHDRTHGYVPTYEFGKDRLLRSVVGICSGLGLGAGMAFRRDFARSIGGFDESFGPGARFPSADEWDIAIRALLNGRHVFETPSLSIRHDGFRTFEQGRTHARRDWLALGAVCAKPLKAGHLRAVVIPLWLFNTKALLPVLLDALKLRKPRGLVRVLAFMQGFAQGMSTPVDRKTLRFE